MDTVKDIQKFMTDYAKKVDSILSGVIEEAGNDILSDAKNLAPVDTGRMNRETEVAKVSDKRVEVRYNIDYSLYVHEDLEARHPKGGQAKFLEQATNEGAAKLHMKAADKLRGVK